MIATSSWGLPHGFSTACRVGECAPPCIHRRHDTEIGSNRRRLSFRPIPGDLKASQPTVLTRICRAEMRRVREGYPVIQRARWLERLSIPHADSGGEPLSTLGCTNHVCRDATGDSVALESHRTRHGHHLLVLSRFLYSNYSTNMLIFVLVRLLSTHYSLA